MLSGLCEQWNAFMCNNSDKYVNVDVNWLIGWWILKWWLLLIKIEKNCWIFSEISDFLRIFCLKKLEY